MNARSQKLLWSFLAVAIALGILWQFYPLQDASNRLNALPLSGPDFKGQIVPLTTWEQHFFKDVGVIKRIYLIDDQYFFVTILDGTHNRHVVHDPYYCFRGGGWTILDEKPYPIPHGDANLVNISKGADKREALYWFSNGTVSYTSPMTYWWQTTLRRLTLGLSGPEPVLIMIQPLTDQHVDWAKVVQDFKPLFKI